MQPTTAAPPRNSEYRLEHCETGLCIRLHSEPALTGDSPRIVPQLVRAQHAMRIVDRDAAALIASTYLPKIPVEIVRVDA